MVALGESIEETFARRVGAQGVGLQMDVTRRPGDCLQHGLQADAPFVEQRDAIAVGEAEPTYREQLAEGSGPAHQTVPT